MSKKIHKQALTMQLSSINVKGGLCIMEEGGDRQCHTRYIYIITIIYTSINLKGTYRDFRKSKGSETSLDTGMRNRAITVLHEQWMCLGMQRHTHITLCSMVTI